MAQHSRESLLEALQQLVEKQGPEITLYHFRTATGIGDHLVYSRWGSWTRLRRAAGLPPRARLEKVYSDDELLLAYHRLAVRLNHYPGIVEYNQLSGHAWNSLAARFGKHPEVRRAYHAWLQHHPEVSPPQFLEQCPPGCEPTTVPGLYIVSTPGQ